MAFYENTLSCVYGGKEGRGVGGTVLFTNIAFMLLSAIMRIT